MKHWKQFILAAFVCLYGFFMLRLPASAQMDNHWAGGYVRALQNVRVMTTGDTALHLDEPVRRVDFERWLSAILGSGAYSTGLHSMTPLTRADAAVYIADAFNLPDADMYVLSGFADYDELLATAKPHLARLVKAGILNGRSEGGLHVLDADKPITVAEAAALLVRGAGTLITSPGEYKKLRYITNAVINTGGVVLEDTAVSGNLVIAEGVGEGEIRLINTIIAGRLTIRGGGTESIYLNNCDIGEIVICRTDGAVRVVMADGTLCPFVYVDDGQDAVYLSGSFTHIVINTDTPVFFTDGTAEQITVTAPDAQITINGTVERLAIESDNVSVKGNGSVTEVNMNGYPVSYNITPPKNTAKADITPLKESGRIPTARTNRNRDVNNKKPDNADKTDTAQLEPDDTDDTSEPNAPQGNMDTPDEPPGITILPFALILDKPGEAVYYVTHREETQGLLLADSDAVNNGVFYAFPEDTQTLGLPAALTDMLALLREGDAIRTEGYAISELEINNDTAFMEINADFSRLSRALTVTYNGTGILSFVLVDKNDMAYITLSGSGRGTVQCVSSAAMTDMKNIPIQLAGHVRLDVSGIKTGEFTQVDIKPADTATRADIILTKENIKLYPDFSGADGAEVSVNGVRIKGSTAANRVYRVYANLTITSDGKEQVNVILWPGVSQMKILPSKCALITLSASTVDITGAKKDLTITNQLANGFTLTVEKCKNLTVSGLMSNDVNLNARVVIKDCDALITDTRWFLNDAQTNVTAHPVGETGETYIWYNDGFVNNLPPLFTGWLLS